MAMIPFDTFTLTAVAAELRRALLDATVQKVQQPSPHELSLALFGRQGAHRLLLSADPRNYRVHLTQTRQESPVNAPGFCQVCRKYLSGARLNQIALPRFDRVLRFVFRAHDSEEVTLVAELMGRNANLVLLSGAGIVRGVLRPTPPDSLRPLRAGQAYADPPGYGEKPDPLALDDEQIDASLNEGAGASLTEVFSGIGPFAAGEIRARAESGSTATALAELMEAVRAERFAPHSVVDAAGNTDGVWAFAPLTVPSDRRFPRESISVALDTFHATRLRHGAEATERGELAKALARETAFRERELTSARATRAEAARADQYEQTGNLLLANLGNVAGGAASVTLPDLYGDGSSRTITLDPKRSPQENARGYFERARKARDAADYAEGRIEDLQEELATLARLTADLERAENAEEVAEIRRALTGLAGEKRAGSVAGAKRAAAAKAFNGHRVRTFLLDGCELLVGETAEANDYLTTRVAAPTDLWLHVRAGTGAHGILRTSGKGGSVPEPVVRRAAEIVAARSGSSVKHARLVAVDVVEKRYVRKPRGAKPGLVTYARERTFDVTPSL